MDIEQNQITVIAALLCASVAALVIPSAVWFIRKVVLKSPGAGHRKSTVSLMLTISAYLIVAMWCLRYCVAYYTLITDTQTGVALTWWEEIFNSMVHTLQSFSMDADYTEYIIKGKEMLVALHGKDTPWQTIYGLYASVLNLSALIAGGAILFELIASIFPKVRLFFLHLAVLRDKYYFSELNVESLALAKSICALRVFILKRPAIIFTDVYIDDESEKSYEILLEARQLGAVCLRDDLAHVKKNRWGRRKFFLSDYAESSNLQTLVDLANERNSRYLKNSEIFLFTNDDTYIQVEKRVCDKLSSDMNFRDSELPTFIPVQSYRNLITNLLQDVPLYEPLIGKERNSDGNLTLTVTILGTGHIGTEMFLNTYWLGQMLNCDLKIRVLSQESEDVFWSKIDYINPEIRRTTDPEDPVLQINRKGEMAKVYCQVDYLQCDLKSSAFISRLTDKHENILDTDYFLVSMGSDAENISVANTIRKYVGQHHIHIKKPVRTVIAYVVYDNDLSDALNRGKFFNFVNEETDVYMRAIGSLKDVYSVRNVFMTEYDPFTQMAYESYMAIQNGQKRAQVHSTRMQDDYKHWADLARVMHVRYKAFSMGMIKESLFDYPEDEDGYRKMTERVRSACMHITSGDIQFAGEEEKAEHLKLLHRMAWLEHRRWNAFTRIKGFRGTSDYKSYVRRGVKGSHKQMDLKLHPCLVECDQKGIRAIVSPEGVVDRETLFLSKDHENFDFLDELSYYLHDQEIIGYDFKESDYPIDSCK